MAATEGAMYRIRLASGEEAVYRTGDEFQVAVQSGVVGPTAEVFHNTTRRWLPVVTHPDYKAAAASRGDAQPVHRTVGHSPLPPQGPRSSAPAPSYRTVAESRPQPTSTPEPPRMREAAAPSDPTPVPAWTPPDPGPPA